VSSPSEPSDAQLVQRCRAGDAAAWAQLVERFSRYVYAIIVQGFRLRDHDAEDVFQEVFAKAYENLAKLRDDGAVRPWLAQLTRRGCIDRLRAHPRERSVDEELNGPALDETVSRLDEAMDVREALGHLSDDCREVLDRFFTRDESYRTIGAELGIPSGTIASRISRCLEQLRAEFLGRKSDVPASGGMQ
jgi:RNA polymerase sigma factor (sigma-70 family)